MTQEALSERELEMQEALLDPSEKTQQASIDREVETEAIILEHKQDRAGPAAGSNDLERPVIPALQKLTHQCQSSANNVIAHEDSTGAHMCGRSNIAKFSADDQRSQRER